MATPGSTIKIHDLDPSVNYPTWGPGQRGCAAGNACSVDELEEESGMMPACILNGSCQCDCISKCHGLSCVSQIAQLRDNCAAPFGTSSGNVDSCAAWAGCLTNSDVCPVCNLADNHKTCGCQCVYPTNALAGSKGETPFPAIVPVGVVGQGKIACKTKAS